jgi:hypothetical protein
MRQILDAPSAGHKAKLLDQVRDVIRRKHYSIRTEQAYVDWIKRFIIYHNKRHPAEMTEEQVAQFLTHLARNLNVAASTQNQALSALLFLYKEVLEAGNRVARESRAREKAGKTTGGSHPFGGERNFRPPSWHTQAYGRFTLRKRIAFDGMRSATGQGHRFRTGTNHSA